MLVAVDVYSTRSNRASHIRHMRVATWFCVLVSINYNLSRHMVLVHNDYSLSFYSSYEYGIAVSVSWGSNVLIYKVVVFI